MNRCGDDETNQGSFLEIEQIIPARKDFQSKEDSYRSLRKMVTEIIGDYEHLIDRLVTSRNVDVCQASELGEG